MLGLILCSVGVHTLGHQSPWEEISCLYNQWSQLLNTQDFACQVASVVSDSLRPYGLLPARLLCPWDSPDKNTGVGCHAFLQGIFPTQGLNPRFLLGRWILYR